MGECRCGCGEDAGVYKFTNASKGIFEGEPKKFKRGHNAPPGVTFKPETPEIDHQTPTTCRRCGGLMLMSCGLEGIRVSCVNCSWNPYYDELAKVNIHHVKKGA